MMLVDLPSSPHFHDFHDFDFDCDFVERGDERDDHTMLIDEMVNERELIL